MKACLVGMAIGLWCIFFAGCSSNAGDFEIEKVVQIGQVLWIPMSTPIQWSPDGTKILFFNKDGFAIADTLGNIQLTHNFGLYPHRYLWCSNYEVCLSLNEGDAKDSSLNELILFNINTKEISVIDQYIRYAHWHDRTNKTEYEGPYISNNGNIYYYHILYTENSGQTGVQRENRWVLPDKSPQLSQDSVLRWGKGALYSINLATTDSTMVVQKPFVGISGGALIDRSRNFVLTLGLLMDIKSNVVLNLDTFSFTKPDNAGFCEIVNASFNPRFPEVIFQIGCDTKDREDVAARMMGSYGIQSNNFEIIDIGLNSQISGAMSVAPDGLKLAFISDKIGYIAYRNHKGAK